MDQLAIRLPRADDAAALARLSGQLGYPSSDEEIRQRLSTLLSGKDDFLIVAELDGRVVGWLHAFAAMRLESGAFAEIGGMVVEEAFRGRGMGRRLVDEASAWARGKGFRTLRVRSNVVREDTHRFYLGLGFETVKSQAVFARDLAGGAGK